MAATEPALGVKHRDRKTIEKPMVGHTVLRPVNHGEARQHLFHVPWSHICVALKHKEIIMRLTHLRHAKKLKIQDHVLRTLSALPFRLETGA